MKKLNKITTGLLVLFFASAFVGCNGFGIGVKGTGDNRAGAGLTVRGSVPEDLWTMELDDSHAILYQVETRYEPANQDRSMRDDVSILGAIDSNNPAAVIAAVEGWGNKASDNATSADVFLFERAAVVPIKAINNDDAFNSFYAYTGQDQREARADIDTTRRNTTVIEGSAVDEEMLAELLTEIEEQKERSGEVTARLLELEKATEAQKEVNAVFSPDDVPPENGPSSLPQFISLANNMQAGFFALYDNETFTDADGKQRTGGVIVMRPEDVAAFENNLNNFHEGGIGAIIRDTSKGTPNWGEKQNEGKVFSAKYVAPGVYAWPRAISSLPTMGFAPKSRYFSKARQVKLIHGGEAKAGEAVGYAEHDTASLTKNGFVKMRFADFGVGSGVRGRFQP